MAEPLPPPGVADGAKGLREEILDTAAALETGEMSHTDVANWLLDLARRLAQGGHGT